MSECSVAFDDDYDGDNEFYVETWRHARKPHLCCECRETIAVGKKYLRVVGKSDGCMWGVAMCEPCKEILQEFNEGSWEFGKLSENFEHAWSNGANLQACMNRVTTVAAKSKLRDMWLAHKGLA